MDTKKIETVLTTVTIDSKVDSGKIDVVVGESAKMDVVKAVNYIQSGKAEIEAGVTEVFNQVDNHVAEKTAEFDQNAQNKTNAFNSNAVNKTGDFNDNYTNKLNAFNQNAIDKTDAFDLNASNKTGDFNTNAINKTTDFNDNYTAKKALIDAQVGVAQTAATNASNSADLSKQWAIGDPTEPAEGSAKYWAEQASQSVPNDGQLDIQVNGSSVATFTANQSGNTTANIVVPDSATWGNITGTLSNQTDLQTALNAKANKDNTINGAPISNTSQYYFGISTTAAATVQKEVTIAGITKLNAGQFIIVLPTITSTVANATLKLNDFPAYPMRYQNAAITTTTDAYTWTANTPSVFVFDGTYWRFVCQGYRQVYSVMSVAEGVAGTATSSRVLRSDYLKEIIETLAPAEVIDQTYSATSTNAQSGTAVAEAISTKYDSSNPAGYITSSALAPYALSSSLSAVATSGAYADLSGTPTIPTVNNPTITITQGGTTKGSFTLNQSANASIDLDSGGSSTITYDPTTKTLTWS